MTSKYGHFAELEYIPPIRQQAKREKAGEKVEANSLRPFRPVSGDHTGKVKESLSR